MHNLEADELHVIWLGVAQYFLGGVLWPLVYSRAGGAPEQNLDAAWGMITEGYKAHGGEHEYSSLMFSSFVDPQKHSTEYPRLKGSGAEARSLVVPLMQVWQKVIRLTI